MHDFKSTNALVTDHSALNPLNRLSRFKRVCCTVLSTVFLLGSFATQPALAFGTYDAQTMAMRAEMVKAMQAGTAAATATQLANDNEAKNAQQCADLSAASALSAQRYIDRNSPPDPTKIIQNTTCHVDVATLKIPIMSTGIGWLDGMITNYLQKFLTGQCTKSLAFLSDLVKPALSKLNAATGGTATALLGYASGTVNLQELQAAGTAAATTLVTNSVNQAVQGGGTGTTSPAIGPSGQPISAAAPGNSAAALMCQYGVPNATYCPLCATTPQSSACIGPKPYCDAFPNIKPPLCQLTPEQIAAQQQQQQTSQQVQPGPNTPFSAFSNLFGVQ